MYDKLDAVLSVIEGLVTKILFTNTNFKNISSLRGLVEYFAEKK